MAKKDWRKIDDNGASITYVSGFMTFASAFEKPGKGWVARTPKATFENQTKKRANDLIKLYMTKHSS